MQFTMSCRDEDGTVTEKRFDGIFLDDVVAKTEDFLKGVGFVFESLNTEVYASDDEAHETEYQSQKDMLISSIYNQ